MKIIKLFTLSVFVLFACFLAKCDDGYIPPSITPQVENLIIVSGEFEAIAWDSTKTDSVTGGFTGRLKSLSVLNTNMYPIDYGRELADGTVTYDVGYTASKAPGTLWIDAFDEAGNLFFGLTMNAVRSSMQYLEAAPNYFDRGLESMAFLIANNCMVYEANQRIPSTGGTVNLDFTDKSTFEYYAGEHPTGTFLLTLAKRTRDPDCEADGGGDSSVVSFASDVKPSFATLGCTATDCHNVTDNAGNLILEGEASTVYDYVSTVVNVSSPGSSLLLTEPLNTDEGGTRHPEEVFADIFDETYIMWRSWIAAGAENN